MNWSQLFFGFDGRIARQTFWVAFVAVAGLEAVCHLVVYQYPDGERLSSIVSLAFAYPEFAVFAKRGYDRNIHPYVIGAFFLLSTLMDFVVIIGLGSTLHEPTPLMSVLALPWMAFAVVLLFELGLRRGTVGPNRYGPDPLAGA